MSTKDELFISTARLAFVTCRDKRASMIDGVCSTDDAAAGGKCPAKTAPNAAMIMIAAINILETLIHIIRNISKQVRAVKADGWRDGWRMDG